MQQVQTSQPVVTWTFMKAIFTGTIRSVASCPPASRIREPGVFCRPPRCGCRKLHPGVRRLEFADSDGAHISYELCGIANWRSRRGSKTHKDDQRLPEAASLALSNRSNFLTIGGFSFAICTTKRSVSSSTLGRPGERRNLDPSNLLAISLPYQPRMVSLRHYTRRCLECGRAREFRPLVQAQVANH